MEVIIRDSYDQISAEAAQFVAGKIRQKPDFVLGLATGSTPLGLYKELIRLHKKENLDFSRVTTFNLDEYVGLPGDHPQSYRYFMNDNLFNHVNIDQARTHVPDGMAKDIAAHCRQYEEQIRKAGGVDLQVLGIGRDGHIGFNEPFSSLASRTRVKTLTEETIDDNARFFAKKEDVPRFAITMGVGTVLDAKACILLANGKSKAKVVAEAIEGPVSCRVTASALQMHPHTSFFLDKEAAGMLKHTDYYMWVNSQKDKIADRYRP